MDANQQRFWMLADRGDWSGPNTAWEGAEYDDACRRLRLRDQRPARALLATVNVTATEVLVRTPSRAMDAYGTSAYWNPSTSSVEAVGGVGLGEHPLTLWTAPVDRRVRDMAMGYDDVLYLAIDVIGEGGRRDRSILGMFDPRGRWRRPPVHELAMGTFRVDDLAADPAGGVWILNRLTRTIGRVRGLPLRDGLPPRFSETTFRPRPENADPPRLFGDVPTPDWVDGEQTVAIASSVRGRLAVISWRSDRETWLHVRSEMGDWQPARRLVDPGEDDPDFDSGRRSMPATLAWLSEKRIVVLPGPRRSAGRSTLEAIPYDPDDTSEELYPAGGFYPVRRPAERLFIKGVTRPPHYPLAGLPGRSAPVNALSVVSYSRYGAAASRMIDSGREQAVWHRIYLEGLLPPACWVDVQLAATDDPDADASALAWHSHVFGDMPSRRPETSVAEVAGGDGWAGVVPEVVARGVWVKDRSEIPHHQGLLDADPEPERAGLFTALVQRPGRRVRRLTGRYLHVRLALHGTGHLTPEVAAVRVYASRFSYRDQYLPEVYGETAYGADADRADQATGPDFLERFLSLFESVLTPMEDRAVAAQAVMAPWSAPPEALDWLGTWMGILFDRTFPEDRRRAWIDAAPRLYRTRGTLAGLKLALEIATGGKLQRRFVDRRAMVQRGAVLPIPDELEGVDAWEMDVPEGGAVTGGELVVVEDYRLRRTLATILGANLSEPDDPLLPGLIVSANSRVGDTLFIGETERQELLALFRDAFSSETGPRESELESVRELYDRLAYRVTVFVHDTVTPVDFGLVDRVAKREAPAHVTVRVVRATHPLLVGVASLVDVDTYLGPRPRPGVARVQRSHLGEGDFVRDNPTLYPGLGLRGASAPPHAAISGPESARRDESITLDGGGSSAATGRVIERYIWMLRP